jgi:ABC-type sugar transport system ATPase subunit
VRDPAAYLMDDPIPALDAKLRDEMRVELKRLQRELGKTLIYVTHDQEEAMTLGDRIVVMKDGLIQQSDTPLKTYQSPKNRFVAGFIGMPPMNYLLHWHMAISGSSRTFWTVAGRSQGSRPAEPASWDWSPTAGGSCRWAGRLSGARFSGTPERREPGRPARHGVRRPVA